jgi:hypothetical protein
VADADIIPDKLGAAWIRVPVDQVVSAKVYFNISV